MYIMLEKLYEPPASFPQAGGKRFEFPLSSLLGKRFSRTLRGRGVAARWSNMVPETHPRDT